MKLSLKTKRKQSICLTMVPTLIMVIKQKGHACQVYLQAANTICTNTFKISIEKHLPTA